MKNRIKITIIIFAVVFLYLSIIGYAADIVKEQQGSKTTRIKKQVYPDNTYEFFNEINYDYGSYIPGQNETKDFMRSIWEFIFQQTCLQDTM